MLIPTLNSEGAESKLKMPIVKEKLPAKITKAAKICCAFAGYNAASIFKKFD